jgi:hypothetical protein
MYIDYKVVETFESSLGKIEILAFNTGYFISFNGGIRISDYNYYTNLQEAKEAVIESLQSTREQIEEYIANNVK